MTNWVVVGAGSAGCVVARRLADTPGHVVTLVEAGPGKLPDRMRGASFFDALAEPGWVYPEPFVRGRGVGGSGAVNGMLATRGDVGQYEKWGWLDAADAFGRILVPCEIASDSELGPLDRALLEAAPDATLVPLTRRGGRRVTAADAYLATPPSTLTVHADAPVARIVFVGRRAVSVELADGRFLDGDAVIAAAGALGSPALLAGSGVEVSGLGAGPRNHPAVPVTLRLAAGVGVDDHGLVTATLLRRGDVQVVPLNHLGPGNDRVAMLQIVLMTPSEHEDGDRPRLTAAVELARELLAHAALRRVVTDVSVGEPPAGVYHATSTCAMGSVVDDAGAVAGYDGLYVVDASVFPEIPSTNPYLPTLMLAERLAARLAVRT
jgi:choline dehydrogenase-like flavoprotein